MQSSIFLGRKIVTLLLFFYKDFAILLHFFCIFKKSKEKQFYNTQLIARFYNQLPSFFKINYYFYLGICYYLQTFYHKPRKCIYQSHGFGGYLSISSWLQQPRKISNRFNSLINNRQCLIFLGFAVVRCIINNYGVFWEQLIQYKKPQSPNILSRTAELQFQRISVYFLVKQSQKKQPPFYQFTWVGE